MVKRALSWLGRQDGIIEPERTPSAIILSVFCAQLTSRSRPWVTACIVDDAIKAVKQLGQRACGILQSVASMSCMARLADPYHPTDATVQLFTVYSQKPTHSNMHI